MNESLLIQISEQSGLPSVWLPDLAMWDLAQYMESHGSVVKCGYGFCGTGFKVIFHVTDENAVKELLNDWRRSSPVV